jgi:CRP-like cAMP-binding protein
MRHTTRDRRNRIRKQKIRNKLRQQAKQRKKEGQASRPAVAGATSSATGSPPSPHLLEQQLCRWLLLSLDRLPSSQLVMTQQLIANMLGVRREGVTEAAGRLQADGLINYRRGRINVLDREKLEQRVCECYGVVRRESDRLFASQAAIAA